MADGGQRRQVEHAEPDHPAAAGEHADLAAGGGAHRGDDDVVVGAAAALARRLVACDVRASRPVEDRSAKHGSSATSSGVAAAVTVVPADSSSTVRRGVP